MKILWLPYAHYLDSNMFWVVVPLHFLWAQKSWFHAKGMYFSFYLQKEWVKYLEKELSTGILKCARSEPKTPHLLQVLAGCLTGAALWNYLCPKKNEQAFKWAFVQIFWPSETKVIAKKPFLKFLIFNFFVNLCSEFYVLAAFWVWTLHTSKCQYSVIF